MALKVFRSAGAHKRGASATVTAQADHQQIDFIAEGGQLVNGNAIHRAAIDAVEVRQALARLAQKAIYPPEQLLALTGAGVIDGARRTDHLHDANAGPMSSR